MTVSLEAKWFAHSDSVCQVAFFVLAFAVATPTVLPADTATKQLEKDGITIQYPAGSEAVATELQTWVSAHLRERNAGPPDDFYRLREKEPQIRALLSVSLAMDEPGRFMQKLLSENINGTVKIVTHLPDLRNLRLWRLAELTDYIRSGQELDGYTFDPETRHLSLVDFSDYTALKNTSRPGPFPVVLDDKADKESISGVKKGMPVLLNRLDQQVYGTVGFAISRAAQRGMVWDLGITGAYRQWFVEGAANVVALAILGKVFSKEAAVTFGKQFDIDSYSDSKGRVNLAHWLAPELARKPRSPSEKRLESARSAFSTYEMHSLMERHGAMTIPKIFAELRKAGSADTDALPTGVSPYGDPKQIDRLPVRDVSAILQAIKKVTGEDFRERLAEYSQGG